MSEGTRPPSVVLVVEDEAGVRTMLSLALRRQGFHPVLCTDGREALRYLQSGHPADAILTDVRMPGLGGAELVAQLRGDARLARLPVLAMSAYNDEQQAREMRSAGADAFLPKPFTIEALAQALHDLLDPAGSSVS